MSLDALIHPAAAQPMAPRQFLVQNVRRETPDTFTLTLARPNPEEGLIFAPGQFNMLYAFGVGEAPISISGDPDRPHLLVHTIREVGNVTRALCHQKPGRAIGVRGPFGAFWPVAEAQGNDVLVVAGGLGLAPLRPAIYYLLSRRAAYGSVEIIYGARTPQDLLYRRELERWRGRFDLRVHVTVDAAPSDWKTNVGVVTALLPRARLDPFHTVAFLCGPGVMMRFTVRELLNLGLKEDRIFVSLERHMKCGLGMCGHCQLGPVFVCKDGPVFRYDRVKDWLDRREV
ncbi:MAG: Ni/Fe hydrogenase subunit gamma [Deltaproteobacteria bacterium]|nr:Ni/Fe hydrogenase subunit gamma [Deltaproteobacteria bacterium]